MLFSEILTRTTVGLIEKGLLFPRKNGLRLELPYLKVNGIYKWSESGCTHNTHILVLLFLTEVAANFLWKNCIGDIQLLR